MELRNAVQRMARLDRAILRPTFLRGWQSIRLGKPFDYSDESPQYERGRQIAIVTRQVLGYVPPLPGGLELVRPIYLNARLRQWSPGDSSGLEMLRAPDGGLSPEKYAQYFFKQSRQSSSSLDDLMGF